MVGEDAGVGGRPAEDVVDVENGTGGTGAGDVGGEGGRVVSVPVGEWERTEERLVEGMVGRWSIEQ